jgi:hypothetical protein
MVYKATGHARELRMYRLLLRKISAGPCVAQT